MLPKRIVIRSRSSRAKHATAAQCNGPQLTRDPEAENSDEVELGLAPVAEALKSLHCENAARMLTAIEEHVNRHIGDAPAGDDVTMLAVTRCA